MKKTDYRNAFFDEMFEQAKKNKDLIFLTGDISAHSLPKFQKKYPTRFYNLGVAEQNMITVATGLAMNKKKVFVFSMIPFLTMRCFEHIKIDICSHNLPVVLIGIGSGLSYDTDGHSAQAIFDIGVMRMLPEIEIYNPSDSISTKNICKIVSKSKKPAYIRLDKSQQFPIYNEKETFNSGFKVFKSRSKNCIVSTGIMTHKSLEIKNELKKSNLNIDVIDLIKIKPLKEKILINILKRYKKIFVIDENTFSGGIGSILSEILIKNNLNMHISFYCLKNTQDVGFYGNREWLQKRNGLDTNFLLKTIQKKIKKK
jgi:transketolase